MGAMFQSPNAPPRARYSMRLRRAVPALTLLLALAVAAGMVWLRVLDRVDGGSRAAAAACGAASSPARPQVRVYNATAREGLARTVAGQLVSRGFVVLATENDPLVGVRQVEGSAEVRFGPSGRRFADQLRREVPGATLYRDAREGPVVDLVLGEKFRRLATSAELARGRQGIAAPPASPAPVASPRC